MLQMEKWWKRTVIGGSMLHEQLGTCTRKMRVFAMSLAQQPTWWSTSPVMKS